jgi:hypothetical protein
MSGLISSYSPHLCQIPTHYHEIAKVYKHCTSEISHPAPFLILWILMPFIPQSSLWQYWVKDQISSYPIWVLKASGFQTATPRFVNTWLSSNWEAHVANTYLFCIHSPISKLNNKNREKKSSPQISHYKCITKTIRGIYFPYIYTLWLLLYFHFRQSNKNNTKDSLRTWKKFHNRSFFNKTAVQKFCIYTALQHILHTHPSTTTHDTLERSDLGGGVISWVKFEG